MDVFEAIKRRYSCRSYEARSIEQDKLARVLEAARLAPSAKNLQDWRFVVVTDAEKRAKLVEAANNQKFVGTAAAIIVACSNSSHVMRCGQAVGPIDVSIALEHISLQAVAEGLGTCWIGSFYPEKVRAVLGIPQDVAVIELMTIGYPADRQKPAKREPIDKIVSYERWQFGSY
ncbi:MAG TPA: nitroreductase [Planctomycetes bacterium]|nr:nitroreductase [Planctomycetota bacterium]HIJ70298.1 nitroreductase [Planctomycetota bacterium]